MTFEDFIRSVIDETKLTQEKSTDYKVVEDTQNYYENLKKAFLELSSSAEAKKIASSGVEWFLDNYHVVQEAIELIQDDLPEIYFSKLPSKDGKPNAPRIYDIARRMVEYYEIELVHNDLHEFLDAYQKEVPLKMSELWALPLMLRLCLIEIISGTIFNLIKNQKVVHSTNNLEFPELDSSEIVARSLRTLILLDQIDWKSFFEVHSLVEKILAEDPGGVYSSMDFESRDIYRKKVEHFSEQSNYGEEEIAQTAVNFAKTANDGREKFKHVGYYLISDGEDDFKEEINYKHTTAGRIHKFFFKHRTGFYLGTITFISFLVMGALLLFSSNLINSLWLLITILLVSFVPATSVATNLVNSILTTILPPRILPKMDYKNKIPRQYRSVVTIPALLSDSEEIQFLLEQLELHYLANKQQNIAFVLLTDFSDAPEESMPEDETLLEETIQGVNRLNNRYLGDHGHRPFYLFHRRRQWNEKENSWIGWERKRGKLADFNRYLLEGFKDSFDTIIGDTKFLIDVAFVITVDADTVLPRDSVKDLIATLSHPLNRAEFDAETGALISGYTILQPRTEVKPTSVNRSLFTRIFAGDLGLDLYTRAVSDIYMDLFAEGIYVGKGIYDVKAFHRSLEGKVPDNALLSHDLFEGIQGRAALVTDIVFFEEYPPNYASQVQRTHRWVRGDWQLLPWLFPKVPMRDGQFSSNSFSIIDLWKIFDNLRRSLFSPLTMLLLTIGWFIFEGNAWVWTLIVLAISAFPLLNNIVTSLSSRFISGGKVNLFENLKTAFSRWLLWLIFLPYDSIIMVDAIITTLIRVYISHKRLLQWQTAAHTIQMFGKQHKISIIWQRMVSAPLLSLAVGLLIYIFQPGCFLTCFPILFLWFFSPQAAYWISLEKAANNVEPLKTDEIQKLRMLARKTWLYFERFIGPEDHWLPPDHFQEDPKGMIAHRTSPTNIGLMMLSTCSAYDMGYIAILDFVYRMTFTFETLDGIEKYRGHLLNWYDTVTLETLAPRYVSTVDSGNYATSLIGLYQTLEDLPGHQISHRNLFQGTIDGLDVFCSVVNSIVEPDLKHSAESLLVHCRKIQNDIREGLLTDSRQMELLGNFEELMTEPMNLLLEKIARMEGTIDADIMKDLRYWSNVNYQHLVNMRSQINLLAPWMETWQERPEILRNFNNELWLDVFQPWLNDRALKSSISEVPPLCERTIDALTSLLSLEDHEIFNNFDSIQRQRISKWMIKFIGNLEDSKAHAQETLDLIKSLQEKISFSLERMEFDFLFDESREVFYLGYQVGSGRLDKNHYDLLGSEARTASLYAIALNEVPRSHWLHMGRPFTTIEGIPTLLSWNGSMFEYLMPNLFTKIYPETLLEQTSKGVVKAQIKYGKKKNVPWGISESSYYRFDQAQNYQYQGFGVPGLGRKRGLEKDLVIAPYASLMAVGIDHQAVIENIADLEGQGAMGHFGFYESIDYTRSRLPVGQDKAVIKSYMAHHQGMIMVALANFLASNNIVERIHKDPRIKTTELLLQEQIPQTKPVQKTDQLQVATRSKDATGVMVIPWQVNTETKNKSVNVISNGNLRMLMAESGSGYLEWGKTALNRWRSDAALDPWGLWYFIQDLEKGIFWSIGRAPVKTNTQEYRVIFGPHMTEIRRMTDDIRVILQTTITPKDDVCVQKISITNQSNKRRRLRVLSYGEVVLAPQSADQQHPAFNKMFIESSYQADLNMLHFQRRKRSSEEKSLGMAHLLLDDSSSDLEYETDRGKFIGRGHDISDPIVLNNQSNLGKNIGITLDPIFSMGKRFELKPNETIHLYFLTIAAENLNKTRDLAKSYQNTIKVENAFSSSESYSEKLLRAMDLSSDQLSKYQKLLSNLIYPNARLRPDIAILNSNTLDQSGLWPFSISGDYPILLVMIDHQEELEALQESLLAHAYWQKLGLLIDLVLLNTKDTGYEHELNEKIHRAINQMGGQDKLNMRGGIFVLTASQMNKDSVILLKTAASAAIDLNSANLETHLTIADQIEPHLPFFMSTTSDEKFQIDQSVERPEDLIFDNGIGGFTQNGKEYQIFLENYPKSANEKGQHTPAPWINVIANQNFGFLVTEAGGGYSWSKNSGENRLTPWTNDPVTDPSGESLYLRDEITGNVWTPTPYPSGNGVSYLVRHGQGYTIFKSYNHGFEQELKLFVDPKAPVKFIQLKLTNYTEESRRLTATYFAEWVLGPNREKSNNFIVPGFINESGALIARNTYSAEFSENTAFLFSDQPVHGLTTDRQEFLGMPGSRSNPTGLRRIGLSGTVKSGVDPCAALQSHLNFAPGESQTITFVLGQGETEDRALDLIQRFSSRKVIEQSWQASVKKWDSLLNKLQVSSPDPMMDVILNRWLPYQALSCRIWGRSAFYQSSGAYGFRDQLQDVTSVMALDPQESREHILRAAAHQFEEGDVLHWWHPPSGRGVRTRITDDLLWLVYVIAEYIEKTGDKTILDEQIPFKLGRPLSKDEEERYDHYQTGEEKFSLFEHCHRALAHADTKGPHGLPLMGSGDWNDGMNRVGIDGKGESVWLAWFLYENHKRFADLCEIKGEQALSNQHKQRAEKLKTTINQVAWDGNWFLRAYYDDGTPLGSHRNQECQIDSLPQSWSIITGGAPKERQFKAIDAVDEHLVQKEDRLIQLFTPPFEKTEKDPGYIKGYPPGIRENGGQYTHAAVWAVWALTELGMGYQAYEQFKLLNPITHSLTNEDANRYAVEPYVVAADIYSKAPYVGRGGWTWYTGSSGWLYRLGMEAILGFKLKGDHFTIDPCIPDNWDGFNITYKNGNSVFYIEVKNPGHIEKGVKEMTLDGEKMQDNKIPLMQDSKDHHLIVRMG
ncbi:MAG: glucoamylase family protein [Brevefilum sp.]|nr:glucoamylase family protein [Brevefilum sp.]